MTQPSGKYDFRAVADPRRADTESPNIEYLIRLYTPEVEAAVGQESVGVRVGDL